MQDNETAAESQDSYPNAGRASGYKDASGNDVGENIINRVTELMVAPQTKLVQLAADVKASHDLQEQRFDYVLRQLQAHLDKEDQRHRVIDASDKTTLDALTSVAHRLDEITSYVQQSVTIAREALTVAKAGAARLGKFKKDLDSLRAGQSRISNEIKEVDARHGGQWEQAMLLITESQADRRAIHQELAAVKADIAALAASSERGDVDALKAQLAELRGDYSPEERARLTGVLLRMIAEYEATHGDGESA